MHTLAILCFIDSWKLLPSFLKHCTLLKCICAKYQHSRLLGRQEGKDPFLFFMFNTFVENERSRVWHFPTCYLFNFPSAYLPLPSKGTSACMWEKGRRLDVSHLGLPSRSMGSRGQKGWKTDKWSESWNEDKQSARSKAVFPFIEDPHGQAKQSVACTNSKSHTWTGGSWWLQASRTPRAQTFLLLPEALT